MRNNIGATDKTIRVAIALTTSIFVFSRFITGPVALAGFLLALGLVITCFKGICPFYRIFRINTNKNLNDKARIYERNETLFKNYLKNYNERYSGIEKEFK